MWKSISIKKLKREPTKAGRRKEEAEQCRREENDDRTSGRGGEGLLREKSRLRSGWYGTVVLRRESLEASLLEEEKGKVFKSGRKTYLERCVFEHGDKCVIFFRMKIKESKKGKTSPLETKGRAKILSIKTLLVFVQNRQFEVCKSCWHP